MTTNGGWWHAPDPVLETYRAAEAMRRRLKTLAGALGWLLIVVCLALVPTLVLSLQPARFIAINATTVLGFVAVFAVAYVPYSALVVPLAFADTGIRTRYVTLWGAAMVRASSGWRIARVRRQPLWQDLMPTSDSVDQFMQHKQVMSWVVCVGLVARSFAMFLFAWFFGTVVGGTELVTYGCIIFGVWALGAAVITALVGGLDALLTRGIERPAYREHRRVTLQTRAAICSGTRPRDIPQRDVDAMIAWSDAFPAKDLLTTLHWARARLTAAGCLIDQGQFDAAIALLEEITASRQRMLATMVLEARFVLAYCLALEGLNLSTAREHYRASRPRHAYPYERAAIKSLFHFHANEFNSARGEAERALRLSRNPLSIGDAAAVREQMHMLLARLDAPRT